MDEAYKRTHGAQWYREMRETASCGAEKRWMTMDDGNCDKDEASYWADEVLSGMHNVNGRIHACGRLFDVMMTWFE